MALVYQHDRIVDGMFPTCNVFKLHFSPYIIWISAELVYYPSEINVKQNVIVQYFVDLIRVN
jgi:hypothetical protein